MTAFKKLSIFFPMWNEEDYLGRALSAAAEACQALLAMDEIGDYELIVVDDASTDATARIADGLAAANCHIVAVHHPKNRKLGGSIKTGLATATGDIVLYADADLPFDMDELIKACRVMRHYEADLVSAYRLDRTGEGYVRSVYSTLYNLLVRVLFGMRIRESMTLVSEGSFIDAEIVVRAQKLGFHIVQFGVDYFPRTRGVSTLSSPSVIVKLLREMFALRRELRAIQPVSRT